jgi:hypothetical protein
MQTFHLLYLINYICWGKPEQVCCEDAGLWDSLNKGQARDVLGTRDIAHISACYPLVWEVL